MAHRANIWLQNEGPKGWGWIKINQTQASQGQRFIMANKAHNLEHMYMDIYLLYLMNGGGAP
eukprot:12355995-Karenia_brevis.AAC.1